MCLFYYTYFEKSIKIKEKKKEIYDTIEANKKLVLDVGGLYVIGTERHESRRVDRQLRGRAGRQGDKGSSVFYVSFEDDLMRKFVSDSMIKRLDSFGFKEGEMLESSMITRSIENAQKRVEEAYRDQDKWSRMALLQTASCGKFTSDRTIQEYVDEIWKLDKVTVEL